MSFSDVIWLSLIQGLTEFLPVSSSAHLVLFSQLKGLPDQGVGFDVALHLGSLAAVVWYLRSQLFSMLSGCCDGLRRRQPNAQTRLGLHLLIATLPVALVGFVARDVVENNLRAVEVVAAATIGFGLLLAVADRRAGGRDEYSLTGWMALAIGAAQVLALIPGTSRSGIVITAALLLGLSRRGGARFAFLLAIPVIAGAGLVKLFDLTAQGQPDRLAEAALGLVISAVVSWLTIGAFLSLVEKIGLLPFVVYRCLLGLWLLFFVL